MVIGPRAKALAVDWKQRHLPLRVENLFPG
jgi:hypothetical protein